jgi:ABC-type nitrate/sulfonate/bicarbonate transport system substrate-binding protein
MESTPRGTLSRDLNRRTFLRGASLTALGAAALGSTTALTACSSSPSSTSGSKRPSVIRATYFAEADYYTLARVNKWFDKATGVPFQWTEIETGAQLNTLYESHEIDIGFGVGNFPIAAGIADGIPFRVIDLLATSVSHQNLVVRKSLNYKGPDSLKGQKIAVIFDSNGQLQLLYWLKLNGISTSDVTLVDMSANQALAAFLAGSINVAYTTEPALSDITAKGGVLESTTAQLVKAGWFAGDMVTVSSTFATQYGPTVERALAALNYAYRYWHTNPSDTQATMAKSLGVSVADAVADMATFELISPTDVTSAAYLGTPGHPGHVASDLGYDASTEKGLGFITATATPSAVAAAIDSSYLLRALSAPWTP